MSGLIKIVLAEDHHLVRQGFKALLEAEKDFRFVGEVGVEAYETLTNRERSVLQLAAEGHTSQEIAQKLFISPRTAETHRANLMRKLGVKSQTDLVRFAIRKKIIPA